MVTSPNGHIVKRNIKIVINILTFMYLFITSYLLMLDYVNPYLTYNLDKTDKIDKISVFYSSNEIELNKEDTELLVNFFNDISVYKTLFRKPYNTSADIYIDMYDSSGNKLHQFMIYKANGIIVENGHYSLKDFCYIKEESLIKLIEIID